MHVLARYITTVPFIPVGYIGLIYSGTLTQTTPVFMPFCATLNKAWNAMSTNTIVLQFVYIQLLREKFANCAITCKCLYFYRKLRDISWQGVKSLSGTVSLTAKYTHINK